MNIEYEVDVETAIVIIWVSRVSSKNRETKI